MDADQCQCPPRPASEVDPDPFAAVGKELEAHGAVVEDQTHDGELPPHPADDPAELARHNGPGRPNQQSPVPAVWEDPLPLAPTTAALPPFPVDALPGWMAAMVEAVAAFFDTPPDVAAFAALGVTSVATARRAWVNARDQRVAVNFYGLAALDSGQRKSGPFTLMATDPLASAAEALQTDENAQAQREGREPNRIRLFTTDASPAGLRDLAAVNDSRIGYVSSESGMFEELAGRYNNGIPDLGLVLAGWNGEPYCADRATKFVPPMHDPVLTVCLTTQPPELKRLAANAAFRDRGLFARLLYGLPPDVVGSRKNERLAVPPEVAQTYFECMRGLLVALHSWDRHEWHVDDAAYGLFHAAEMVIEPKLLRGAEYGGNDGMREWASKYTAHILKIAGLLHAAEHIEPVLIALGGRYVAPKAISEQTMRNALELGAYFVAHAEATFGFMRADPRTEDARDVLGWLHRIDWKHEKFAAHPEEVTRREVIAYNRCITDAPHAATVMRLLEDHGFVQSRQVGQSARYAINPRILSAPSAPRDPASVPAGKPTTRGADRSRQHTSAPVSTRGQSADGADKVLTDLSAPKNGPWPANTRSYAAGADDADAFGVPSDDRSDEDHPDDGPPSMQWRDDDTETIGDPVREASQRHQPHRMTRAQRHGKGR